MDDTTPRTILLVEDSPADVYLIREALAECDHAISLAIVPDGDEALAFLRKESPFSQAFTPALIVLDLHLPRLSGLEVLRTLRLMPAYQATPVVILSVAAPSFAADLCLHAGASAYVQKPSAPEALLATIRALVSQWLPPRFL